MDRDKRQPASIKYTVVHHMSDISRVRLSNATNGTYHCVSATPYEKVNKYTVYIYCMMSVIENIYPLFAYRVFHLVHQFNYKSISILLIILYEKSTPTLKV